MKGNKLSAGRTAIGVILLIIFFPFMFLLPIAAGNLWIAESGILNSASILDAVDGAGGYEKVQDILIDEISGEKTGDKELIERVIKDVFDEECFNAVLRRFTSEIFGDEDVETDIAGRLRKNVADVFNDIYEKDGRKIIDSYVGGRIEEEYPALYSVCGSLLDEKLLDYGSDRPS